MRNDHRQPFDIEAREAADVTQQFWGTTKGWSPHDLGAGEVAWDDRTPRSIQALRSGLAGMRQRRPQQSAPRTGRTRVHGAPRQNTPEDLELSRREATLGELAAGWIDDDDWPELDFTTQPTRRNAAVTGTARRVPPDPVRHVYADEFDEDIFEDDDVEPAMVPLSPVAPLASRLGLGAVDPLLARIGAIVLIGVLLIPFALAARGGKADQVAGDVLPLAAAATGSGSPVAPATAFQSTAQASTADAAPETQTASDPTTQSQPLAAQTMATSDAAASTAASAAVDAGPDATDDDPQSSVAVSSTAGDVPESAQAATTAPVEVATVSEVAARVEPDCSLSYEAHAGDSWYRIADGAGITPKALIDHNLATLDTPIYPGDEICLPAGASIPSPPTTTSPPPSSTTAAPATTTTVKATTTTNAPPPAPASTARVQELIREIWPDELEERALQIAWRESNYKATAYNGTCCYGVFQIHWTSHKSWLDDYGITSTNDLLDARKNITAAYALYQRAGGWGPWGG